MDMNGFDEQHGFFLAEWSTELYEGLAKKLVGDALTTLHNVPKMCGFEVWR